MKVNTVVPVDINNEFIHNAIIYKISKSLKQYIVHNKPKRKNGKYNNWTNDAKMDSIMIVEEGKRRSFFDEKGKNITNYVTVE
ncbi:hypothetical protein [Chengkuizengella marina]|uniref:Uncharacterized protein n=1 Tax=Chengkuizengella marina TaxID=2507566 RepID=A0A6N9Q0G4_9BACL|nr:hypothetical protein [Chengkuizengella marina]NBI28612.1 hypothetical protein [Chengkuizengella marina]